MTLFVFSTIITKHNKAPHRSGRITLSGKSGGSEKSNFVCGSEKNRFLSRQLTRCRTTRCLAHRLIGRVPSADRPSSRRTCNRQRTQPRRPAAPSAGYKRNHGWRSVSGGPVASRFGCEEREVDRKSALAASL